ncbi:MAG: uracil-DNA glycosylase [Nitrosospira sp.]|nr:uracil-DNA glycosylase [Nitrosospira sp.]
MSATSNARRARRKELILRELGLMPLWRARAGGVRRLAQAPQMPHEIPAIQPEPGVRHMHDDNPAEDRRSEMILRMDWDQLRTSVEGCVACPLCRSRTRTVLGAGDPNGDWLYVGEGPGAQEDATGEPFVGPAGQLLDNMLTAIGLKRGRNVYIANIVKCRPPGNREPTADEAACCAPYLVRQIKLMQPKLIIALGKVAAYNLLHGDGSLASLRGRLHKYAGIPVIVTYHPAYLLRNMPAKAKAWEDLCFARSTMQTILQSSK